MPKGEKTKLLWRNPEYRKHMLKVIKKNSLFQKGNQIRKGQIPWNKDTKGLCKSNKTTFKKGMKKLPTMYVFPKGKNHPFYKGRQRHQGSYIFLYRPDHPFCNKQGCIKRARFVMEKKLGRYLKSEEVVHHINEIRDNDRPENLQLFTNNSEHLKFHFIQIRKTKAQHQKRQ